MERKMVQNVDPPETILGATQNRFQKEFQYLILTIWERRRETRSSRTNLLSEPFVQLLTAVEHKSFSLWTFLTLSHQSGILVSFKQPWNLTTTQNMPSTFLWPLLQLINCIILEVKFLIYKCLVEGQNPDFPGIKITSRITTLLKNFACALHIMIKSSVKTDEGTILSINDVMHVM